MKKSLAFILSVLFAYNAYSQANITTNSINQGFSFTGNVTSAEAPLPRNWRLSKSSSVRTIPSYPFSPATKADTTTQFRGGSLLAANAPAGFYNFGVGDSTTATNRCIGFLADANNVKTCNMYFHIKNNNVSSNITSFSVDVFIRKFKNGTNADGFYLKMYYSRDGVNWTDAGIDLQENFTPDANDNGLTIVSTTPVTISKNGFINEVLTPGQQFFFCWSYSVISGTNTANAPALGIDAVLITPTVALPVTLLSFEAEKLAKKVQLQWNTATEINNEKFIVERSSNGKDFSYLTEVKGAGNSKEINNYTVVDERPLAGTSYYRLTQIDYDGKSEVFELVAINMNRSVLSMELGAGSGEQGVLWNIYAPFTEMATVQVHDLNGRLVHTEKIKLTEGYQQYTMPTLGLEKGMYVMSVVAGQDAIREKIRW